MHWSLVKEKPVISFAHRTEFIEQSALYKFNGTYYVTGHSNSPRVFLPGGEMCGRVMIGFYSKDFVHWPECKALCFYIPSSKPVTFPFGGEVEQVHMGASIWNRNNVLVGIYGQWHGSDVAQCVTADLGLVVSNDGIHFREPIRGFKLIPRGKGPEWDHGILLQGNAFVNVGDKTYVYYGGSPDGNVGPGEGTSIGLVTLRRDGFGYLSIEGPVDYGYFLTCPLSIQGKGAKLFVNADGLSEDSFLKVELLDLENKPIKGYSENECKPVTKSGVHEKVSWQGKKSISTKEPFMIKVSLHRKKPAAPKVYALYLTS